MNTFSSATAAPAKTAPAALRLDYLDATRAFALLLGIVFHASLSFLPVYIGWAIQDVSTSPLVGVFCTVSHSFRMVTFFLLAGFLAHVSFHRKGALDFVRSRALRIAVPLVVGWFILRPLLVSGWIMGAASLRGDYHFWEALRWGIHSLNTLPEGLFTGTHLWFLYYLGLITGLTLLLRGVVKAIASRTAALERVADVLLIRLASSTLAPLWLAAPTAVALWGMRAWSMDTPDLSLRPLLPVLAIYGGGFILGWLLGRQPGLLTPLTRLSAPRWILAAVGIVAVQYLDRFQSAPGHPYYQAAHLAAVLAYALMMWSLVLLCIGVFRTCCARPRAWIRYLADASYWLYLVHLPLVIWLQVAVAEAAFHWSLKLAFVSSFTVALGLLSYDCWVRSTWLGVLLNGRRHERGLAWLITKRVPKKH